MSEEIGVTGQGTIAGFRAGASGGYVVTLHIPDYEQAKKVFDLHEKNVEFAFVELP